MRFEGKVALVTGGGTGIGAATADLVARQGGRVVVVGRRPAPIDAVARRCGGRAVVADAADPAQMDEAVRTAVAAFGHLDMVVASAGSADYGGLGDVSDEHWAAGLRGNLTAAMVTARTALPALVETRGVLCVVASIAAVAAGPQSLAYTAAKHGQIGLVRSIARDYGPLGIRCNAVSPGWTRTEMSDRDMEGLARERALASADAAYALATEHVPLRRAATAEEVAEAVAFLCSDAAAMITGVNLPVDGGSTVVDVPTLAFAT